jgi:two-component system, NtrC family, C4-dicarboxylate transport sensor histidine kinase DctB
MTSSKRIALTVLGLIGALSAISAVYLAAEHRVREDVHAAGQRQLQIIALDLESVLEKFESLPFALAFHPDVAQMLARPQDKELAQRLDVTLQTIQRQSKVSFIYLMDRNGKTLASSNWDEPLSFVGRNFGFRPYFRDALNATPGRFYGIGSATSEPGYFIAQPVYPSGAPRAGEAPAGVIAVKISLDEFEQSWRSSEEPLALADSIGVVFLSNRPDWKYHSLQPLDQAASDYLAGSLQYVGQNIEPIATLPKSAGFGDSVAQPVGRLGWQLMLFPSQARITRIAGFAALAAALLLTLFTLSWWAYHQRARRLQESKASRKALQQAAEELERKIVQRTQELLLANQNLKTRYATLQQTEHMLRTTQNELVQAGKLAMLGQMAAGVTHELNQPLAAIRAFADNAVTLLARGQAGQAGQNLAQISAASARMGSIIAQLKGFARKSHDAVAIVDLRKTIHASATLLQSEFRRHDVELSIWIEDELPVVGDVVRTEQVLINLLRNALDAVENAPAREVSLTACRDGAHAVIKIRDSGAGIPEQVRHHLFEPFFTTKPSGKGLGLGLAISSSIVQAMNGELSGHNPAEGGAEFVMRLPLLASAPKAILEGDQIVRA